MDYKSEKMIFDIHCAFLNEYSLATRGLSEFYGAVGSFFSHVIKETENGSGCLDQNIHSVQEICFFLKTFCSEIELHTQLLKAKIKDKPTDADVIEEQSTENSNDMDYKLPENPNEIYPYEVYPEIFTYKTIDPSEFEAEHKEEFFISYIKDDTSYLFFMMKASRADIVIEQPEFRYDMIPPKGTVFGLLLDGVIFRAVRENFLKSKPKTFKVILIDFGEIIEISKDFKMYRLTEDMQQIPGQSIFCKLNVNEDESFDSENFLREKLYSKQNVRIDRVYKNMLEVTFVSPSAAAPGTSSSSGISTMTREFSNLNILPKDTRNQEILAYTTSNKRNDSLTQEELDELNEEPFTTENALEAVMGYIPQDDRRICKFYDPKTKACFKGANCKKEHTTILRDGWTKDQRTVKLKTHTQLPLPKVGKKVNLFVQYVDDVDKFYGQIVPKNCKSTDDLPAEFIFQKINTPEMKSTFKKLLEPPAEFELVFALFDGDWYRARILQKCSDIHYRVFYVDYGNCSNINISEMRQWDDQFDCYPFQAVECKLDNIVKRKSHDPITIAFFEKLVFRKSVTATVTSNFGTLLVTLQTQDFDVGEQLVAAQFATLKPITQFGDTTIPG